MSSNFPMKSSDCFEINWPRTTNWTASLPFRSVFLLLSVLLPPLLSVPPRFRRQRSCKDGGFATRCTRNLRHAVQYYTEGEYFTAGQVQRKRRHRRYGTRRRILNRSWRARAPTASVSALKFAPRGSSVPAYFTTLCRSFRRRRTKTTTALA